MCARIQYGDFLHRGRRRPRVQGTRQVGEGRCEKRSCCRQPMASGTDIAGELMVHTGRKQLLLDRLPLHRRADRGLIGAWLGRLLFGRLGLHLELDRGVDIGFDMDAHHVLSELANRLALGHANLLAHDLMTHVHESLRDVRRPHRSEQSPALAGLAYHGDLDVFERGRPACPPAARAAASRRSSSSRRNSKSAMFLGRRGHRDTLGESNSSGRTRP